MNVRYDRCLGVELFTEDGRRILDFLSGYCVHNVGHKRLDLYAQSESGLTALI
jgi:ornithine--oxo-acid transaminase